MLLRLDYELVYRQASEMEGFASELDTIVVDADSILTDLDSIWQGEACERYAEHCYEVETSVKNLSRGVNRTASTIKRIADLIHEAEEESRRIAEKMKSLK
ncbi:MAG: hypothetical protein GX640_02930 [Fibrobacter sp.]|nr:hypothetical protein [Fibrobacter sp.]